MTEMQYYVYEISVDGVVRYIGKGSNGRLHFHIIEAQRINRRRALGANTDRTSTQFYRKLAEAIRRGAVIVEQITDSCLSDQEAYRIEKLKIEKLYLQDPTQLWNSVDERFIGVSFKEYKQRQLDAIKAALHQ